VGSSEGALIQEISNFGWCINDDTSAIILCKDVAIGLEDAASMD
jgi:hypothetical protein